MPKPGMSEEFQEGSIIVIALFFPKIRKSTSQFKAAVLGASLRCDQIPNCAWSKHRGTNGEKSLPLLRLKLDPNVTVVRSQFWEFGKPAASRLR